MTDFTKLTDTTVGRRNRQRKRRQALDEIAKKLGYDTWTRLETAVLHGDVILTTAHIVDLQPNKNYFNKPVNPAE